jgi:hypothetical protein
MYVCVYIYTYIKILDDTKIYMGSESAVATF